MIGEVAPWVTDAGVFAAVFVAVAGAVRAVVVPVRNGLRTLDRIDEQLTYNGGGSVKDMVRQTQQTVGEIQEEQVRVRMRLDKLETI